MAKVAYRGRTGVEDGKHGEQERAAASRPNPSRGERGAMGRKPDDGVVRTQSGPDSKNGGRSTSTNPHTTSENPKFFGDPANTVAMPVVARGGSTPGGYRTTGGLRSDGYSRHGQLGNNEQASYNQHPGHEGGKGAVLGEHKANFYNELGGGKDSQEGNDTDESGSGVEQYGKSIEGFGAGKSTFQYESDFYNDLDETGAHGECDSGSGPFTQKAGGPARKITGFSATDGEITGFV